MGKSIVACSWQDLGPVERETHTGAGLMAGLVTLRGKLKFLKGYTLWKAPMLEQFMKNCSPWEGPHIAEVLVGLSPVARIPW